MIRHLIKRAAAVILVATICASTAITSFAETQIFYRSFDTRDFDFKNNIDNIVNVMAEHTSDKNTRNLYITSKNRYYVKNVNLGLSGLFAWDDTAFFTCTNNFDVTPNDGSNSYYTRTMPTNFTAGFAWDGDSDHAETARKLKESIAEAKRIAATVPEGTNEEKLRYITQHLCNNMRYMNESTEDHAPYNALLNGRGCCQAYTNALFLIACFADIPIGICSMEVPSHAYNYTFLEDGSIRFIDATYADDDAGNIDWSYFMYQNDQLAKLIYEAKDRNDITKNNFDA